MGYLQSITSEKWALSQTKHIKIMSELKHTFSDASPVDRPCMSATQRRTFDSPDGEAEVEKLEDLSGGGARIEIDVDGGPRWRLDVNGTGSEYELVTSRNAADELADVDVPRWVDDLLIQLQTV